jgi:type II secretion system protein G
MACLIQWPSDRLGNLRCLRMVRLGIAARIDVRLLVSFATFTFCPNRRWPRILQATDVSPEMNAMFRISKMFVLVIAMFSGCDKRGVNVEQRQGEGRNRDASSIAQTQVTLFVTALDRYRQSLGTFPSTRQGLQALRTSPADLPKPNQWNGPYLNPEISLHPLDLELPIDPWDHPYHYRSPGIHNPDGVDVWSVGPDGVDGSVDDIGNWK